MTIISLTAENVMKIRAATLKPPAAGVVQICGPNDSGKTSLMESIAWAFGGDRVIPLDPIREGTERALIRIETGEFVVEKTIKRATKPGGKPFTTALAVYGTDGLKRSSPQAVLDAFIDGLAFDPEAFVSLKPDAQFNMLRSFVREFDFDEHDRAQADAAEKRKALGRDIAALKLQIGPDLPWGSLPALPIDETALIDRLSEASSYNASIEHERMRRTRLQMDIDAARLRVDQMRAEAVSLRERARGLDEDAAEKADNADLVESELSGLAAFGEPVDAQAVRAEIDAARDTNARIRQRDTIAELRKTLTAKSWDAETVKDEMEEREETKRKAIADAAMPVPGLGFGDKCILLNGHPFEQASSAVRMRVALAIAFAKNPLLKVARIKNGSLLDDASLAAIEQMAVEHGFQVWVERVDTSGAVGFVIEDGEVREAGMMEAAE